MIDFILLFSKTINPTLCRSFHPFKKNLLFSSHREKLFAFFDGCFCNWPDHLQKLAGKTNVQMFR